MLVRNTNPESDSFAQSVYTGVLMGLFVVFCLASVAFVVIREQFSSIQHYTVSGNVLVSSDLVSTVAKQISVSQCSVMFRCGYGLWYPSAVLLHNVKTLYPRVESLHTSFDFTTNTLMITITERRTYAAWCTDTTLSNCYALDQQGVLFERLPYMQGRLHFPLLVPDGQHILALTNRQRLPLQLWSEHEFRGLVSVFDVLSQFARPGIVLYAARDMRVYLVQIYDKQVREMSYIKLNREKITDSAYKNYIQKALDRFSSYPDFSTKFYADPANLEYLDMRFMGRVYMKFRN